MDNDKIITVIDEDTHSTIKIEHFIKLELISNTYLLFIAKNQFIYVPLNAFKNNEDRAWFEAEIINRIKK